MISRTLILAIGLLMALDSIAVEQVIGAGYQTRYVTEGRDNLTSGGIASLEYSLEAPVSIAAWHGRGTSESYDETQLSLTTTFSLGDGVEASIGLASVSASLAGHRDNDEELSVSISLARGVSNTRIDVTWSQQQAGVWLALDQSLSLDRWLIGSAIFLALGSNQGYVPGERRGVNHIDFGLRGIVGQAREFSLDWTIAHTGALRAAPGDTMINGSWATIVLRYRF